MLLLSVRLLGGGGKTPDRATRRLLYALWTVGLVVMVWLFSRATLLLLPLAIVASGILPLVHRRVKMLLGAATIASLAVAWASYSAAIMYLLTTRSTSGESEGFLGSYGSRVALFQEVVQYSAEHLNSFLFGLGTSGYSVLMYGSEIVSTHNTFLDTLVESGVGGLALLLAIMGLMLVASVRAGRLGTERWVGTVAVLSLAMLMTREFTFAYLFATSLGGVCFVALFVYLSAPEYRLPDASLAARLSRRRARTIARRARVVAALTSAPN